MNGAAARFVRLGASLAGLVLLAWILTGQAAKPAKRRISLPTDWSHRHAIFSQPQTAEEYARLADEPRYWQQIYRRQSPAAAVASAPTTLKAAMHRDWAIDLGTGGGIGQGNYPAKFGFDVTKASCSDFAVFGTGLLANTSQAAVVGFTNLYSGCSGSPTINWAYDTGGRVTTSPIISLDGTQIAFVQDGGISFPASVVLIKWKAATGQTVTNPKRLASQAPGAYATCPTLPCMTRFALTGGGFPWGDTISSIFYDFKNDVAWVGDAGGYLHQFTPFFNGTPAEVTTAPWPILVNPGNNNILSSPVFDRSSGNIFVGDLGGILYGVNAATGVVTPSGQLDFGDGIVDAPIIDVAGGLLYVFVSNDGSTNCASGSLACAGIYQLSTTFTGLPIGEAIVGDSVASGNATNVLYIGAFDTTYYNSPTRTGNLYVCGNTGANPTLYRVPISGGVIPATGTAITSLTTPASNAQCSSVTDIPNPNGGGTGVPAERMFVSVQNNGLSKGCSSGGCIMNFVSAEWQASTVYAVGQQILDSGGRLQTVASVTGDDKSGGTVPAFGGSVGGIKLDNHITWINQGLMNATTLNVWQGTKSYAASARIVDSTGNVEVCTHAGTSGSSQPSWPAIGQPTTGDGTVNWINTGPVPTFALPASGGTSGIIEDNAVSQTMQPGASQVYFTTLADQACSGGTGGCAVQASQPALQ